MSTSRRQRSVGGGGALLLLLVVVVLVAVPTAVVGFVHPFAATKRTTSSATILATSSEDHENNEEKIAEAWRNVNADMTRNDLEALEVLKELRSNLKSLVDNLEDDTTTSSSSSTDESAEELVSELATKEAMEFAEKESRIAAAKAKSEGMTMQAKLDLQLQQQQQPTVKPLMADTPFGGSTSSSTPSASTAAVGTEEAKEELAAELAKLDDQAKALSESIENDFIPSTRTEQDDEEGAVIPPTAASPEEEQPAEVVEAKDEATPTSKELAAELAELGAQAKALRESIQNDSIPTTTGTSVEQECVPTTPAATSSIKEKEAEAKDKEEAAAIQFLVAQLATRDAMEVATKQSRIDAARQAAEGLTMQAKLDQQLEEFLLQQQQELEQHQQQQLEEDLEEEQRQFEQQLLQEQEELLEEQQVDQAYMIMAKEMMETTTTTSSTNTVTTTEQQQQERRSLQTKLASLEAAQFAVLMDMAKSDAVAKEAAKAKAKASTRPTGTTSPTTTDTPPPPTTSSTTTSRTSTYPTKFVSEEQQQVNKMTNELTKMEAEQFALQIDVDKSNSVQQEALRLMHQQEHQQKRYNKMKQDIVTKMEAKQFAQYIDRAKSNAVQEDERISTLEEARKRWEQQQRYHKMRDEQNAAIMARKAWEKQVSIQVDEEWADALQLASIQPPQPPRNGNNPVIRNGMAKELLAEAQLFAHQIDTAKSEAVKMDAAAPTTTVGGMSPRIRSRPHGSTATLREVIDPVGCMTADTTATVASVPTIEEEDDEDIVTAEPFFIAEQNPNQIREIVDVQALKSAAQEVQEASELLQSSNVLQDSVDKQAIIQAAMEAANSVLKNLEAKEEAVKEPKVTKTAPVMGLEPLPQDVRNHQEDAKRFFFAKRAAEEISERKQGQKQQQQQKQLQQQKKQLPPPQVQATAEEAVAERPKELSAAELAAKEHDEVDQQLRELFADVSLGFEEVKQSLARLMRSDEENKNADDDDELKGSGGNSTSFDGVTP